MNDRLPGSSPHNPIKYRGYAIHLNDDCDLGREFVFWPEGHDGEPDAKRCGAGSLDECMAQIDKIEGFAIPSVVVHKPTGDLLVARRVVEAGKHFPLGAYECSPIDVSCSRRCLAADALEPAPPRRRGQRYDLRTDLEPRLQGMLPWEVIESADLTRTLANIASCAGWSAYPGIAWVTKPGQRYPAWARVFLHRTQGGGYTGEAHALVYESGCGPKSQAHVDAVLAAASAIVHQPHKAPAGDLAAAVLALEAQRDTYTATPSAWRLAICNHEVKSTGTPHQNMRGWRPAHCVKCGLDLSVDSSD